MLTLPKNMFYTVTLPATLWFFDKAKKRNDNKILFIDARNIFRQVTRSMREFTEEHIQNIAVIVRLYRGETKRFKQLLAKYQKQANDFEKQAQQQNIVVEKTKKVKPKEEKEIKRWEKLVEDEEKKLNALTTKQNYFLGHIDWLNERFPNGIYEDVTGLCKAATLAEIEEQEYSLNPGRYVGVVIEEDGLTEEEFMSEIKERHIALSMLNAKASDLENLIDKNLKQFSIN